MQEQHRERVTIMMTTTVATASNNNSDDDDDARELKSQDFFSDETVVEFSHLGFIEHVLRPPVLTLFVSILYIQPPPPPPPYPSLHSFKPLLFILTDYFFYLYSVQTGRNYFAAVLLLLRADFFYHPLSLLHISPKKIMLQKFLFKG